LKESKAQHSEQNDTKQTEMLCRSNPF